LSRTIREDSVKAVIGPVNVFTVSRSIRLSEAWNSIWVWLGFHVATAALSLAIPYSTWVQSGCQSKAVPSNSRFAPKALGALGIIFAINAAALAIKIRFAIFTAEIVGINVVEGRVTVDTTY
jgi:hypothetical protein